MDAVLGIDAAWTSTETSGVALIARRRGRWSHVRSSPSYYDFVADHGPRQAKASSVDVSALLRTCEAQLAGQRPQVVAVDMPIGHGRISARRPADTAISKAFGHAKCSVHSPTEARPGMVGVRLVQGFTEEGYALRFGLEPGPVSRSLLEVYPHVALLDLMQQKERLAYKCNKSKSYWKDASLPERRRRLLEQWRGIEGRLSSQIDGVDLGLPPLDYDGPLSHLKAYEDRLDAIVCAWVGALYLEGKTQPVGDAHSAIWVPSGAMKYAKQP